jgi:hypothetical protein
MSMYNIQIYFQKPDLEGKLHPEMSLYKCILYIWEIFDEYVDMGIFY